jgi:protease I
MAEKLSGKRVAILVTDGFEQVELTEPRKALDQAGAKSEIVSPASGKVKGWQHTKWGDELPVDVALDRANPEDYDALLLPGGVMNPDRLRMNEKAVAFVRHFVQSGKPIAAICHGPWTLIEAGAVEGRKMTSWPSLQTDLKNAGAQWVDQEVVVDNGLVTSRKPDDLPAFNRKMIEEFAEGSHGRRAA